MTALLAPLWDFAGTDGCALAREVFGPGAARLAVHESLETSYEGVPCSLLRLCEGNFRVGGYAEPPPMPGDAERTVDPCAPQRGDSGGLSASVAEALHSAGAGRRVWVKACRLASILLPEEFALQTLLRIATVKAPHRLAGLSPEHAVPARLGGNAALVWRHPVGGAPTVEIQTAPEMREAVCRALSELSGMS